MIISWFEIVDITTDEFLLLLSPIVLAAVEPTGWSANEAIDRSCPASHQPSLVVIIPTLATRGRDTATPVLDVVIISN